MNEKKILGILMKQTLNRKIAQLLSKNCLTKLGSSCMLLNSEKYLSCVQDIEKMDEHYQARRLKKRIEDRYHSISD